MSRHDPGSRAGPEGGSFTAELALLAPVLMLFALLAVAVGRYELAREEVVGAARAAAEAAAVAPSAAEAQPAAASAASPAMQGLGRTCVVSNVDTDTSEFVPGGDVRVTVTCRVDFSDLLVPGFPGTTTVKAVQMAPIDPYRSVQ
ncbi:MAG TPA: TadE/TadG family type IV pilus assembly protein [Acidimicrobiales bacterium]|nr:TadE/TadG family type IV pilus assembly protein [Acidimicrobiales bacterium]